MAKKLAIIIDDGHGMETAGKRSPLTGMLENEFNSAVGRHIKAICMAKDILYKEVAPTDKDTPLYERTKAANTWYSQLQKQYGANLVCVYLSIHANAGGGSGVEVWVYHNADSQTLKAADNIVKELCKLGLKNRGVHKGYICKHKNKPMCGCNFAVNRDTNMPSYLIEHAFMDTNSDAQLLIDDRFRKNCAIADVTAICNAYGFDSSGIKEVFEPVKPVEKKYRLRIQTFSGEKMIEKGKALAAFMKLNSAYNDGLKEYEPGKYRIDCYSYTGDDGKSVAVGQKDGLKLLGIYSEVQEM